MMFTEQTRGKIIRAYVVLFYVLALFKWSTGMWLYQHDPFIFRTRFDGVTWLFMQTGLHQFLLQQKGGYMLMDIFFYSMPLLYYRVYRKIPRYMTAAGFVMLVVNWFYVQIYTLYPTNSLEGHVAWLLMPLLFMMKDLKSFYYVLQGLRYFFLYFFASAGLWKIYEGGLFNLSEMSNLLLFQHKEQLVSSPGHWFTEFIYWLVKHPAFSYALYVLATMAELVFIAGFFTKRWDRWLVTVFLAFVAADLLVMKINYFEVLPFLIPMYYAKYALPANKTT